MNPKDKIIKLQGAVKARSPVAPGISVYTILFSLLVMLLCTPVLYAQEVNVDNIVIDIGNGSYFVTDGSITIQNLGGIKNNGTVELKGNWANITANGLIFGSTGTVIFNGISSGQAINGPNSTVFTHLTIDNSNGITLNVPANVNGILSFLNGKILAPTVAIEIGLSGNIIGAGPGKYIYGLLYKDVNTGGIKNFEVGDATIYAPVNLNLSGFSGNGSIGVYTLPGFNPNENNPVTNASGISQSARANRYWNVSSAGISFSGSDATFNFDASEATGNPLNYVVRKFDFPSTWSATTTGTVTATSTQALGLTSFSEFEVGIAAAPTIICNGPLNVNNTPNLCTATITIAQLLGQVTANGSPTPTVTFSPPAGIFPVGSTPVTATVTNINGSNSCIFNVVVTDNQPPTAVCQNITVNLDNTGNATITPAMVNNGSTDNCGTVNLVNVTPNTFNCSNITPAPTAWINEFHYDNTGADVGEFIEIAGNAGLNLTGWSIVLYNGTGGASYSPLITLSGTIPNQSNGFGTVSSAALGLQNGSPDGFALVNNLGAVVQFLSYEGTFTAVGGPANGMTSVDVGVSEGGGGAVGNSLRLSGTGSSYASFTWQPEAPGTPGAVNTGQSFVQAGTPVVLNINDGNGNNSSCTAYVTVQDVLPPTAICQNVTINLDNTGNATITPAMVNNGSTDNCSTVNLVSVVPSTFNCTNATLPGSVWINEFHYDNSGTDAGEFVEVAGVAGLSLSGWSIVLYNGANGLLYDTDLLSGSLPNQSNGIGTTIISYPTDGIHNGAPDGIALVNNLGAVVQFLSYEGTFTAVGGPANGMTSADIGVSETGSLAAGGSIRLAGSGTQYSHFTWQPQALGATPGAINTGQTPGNIVTLTVSDGSGNTSTCTANVTVQDATPPVITVCAPNQNVNLNGTCQVVVPNLVAQTTATDNCTVTVTQSPIAGTALASSHNQTHNVVITATDAAGNFVTCTTVLTGKDVTNPVITVCAPNQNVNLNGTCQLVVPNLVAQTTAADNCTVTVSQSPIAGTALASSHNQTHNVVITATDAAGNFVSCTTVLTGKDVTNHDITVCAPNQNIKQDET